MGRWTDGPPIKLKMSVVSNERPCFVCQGSRPSRKISMREISRLLRRFNERGAPPPYLQNLFAAASFSACFVSDFVPQRPLFSPGSNLIEELSLGTAINNDMCRLLPSRLAGSIVLSQIVQDPRSRPKKRLLQ